MSSTPIEGSREAFVAVRAEVAKAVVGQDAAVSGMIVALLADGLTDAGLKKFYGELAKSEDGHTKLFARLALAIAPEEVVSERLDALLDAEAELIRTLPVRAAIH